MSVTFRKLSEFLKESVIKEDIDNSIEYKCGGVRLNGRGVFVREIKLGSDIQKQWVMHKVRRNNVVYSTLFADKGAFAIATEKDEELVFSEKFVCFEITDDQVLPEYLHIVFQTDYLSSQCDEFKTGMAAFSLSHSSKKKVLKLSIPIPDVPTQEKIIREYASYEKLRSELDDSIEFEKEYASILKIKYVEEKLGDAPTTPLSNLGRYLNRPTVLELDQQYKQITVKLHGKGLVLRKYEEGANIKSNQFLVNTNDLVYSKIDVKSGAIGFVPPELDGGIVTADFPVIVMPELTDIDREFLMIYFSSNDFCAKLEDKSKGTTNRVRTKKGLFLETVVPWGTSEFRENTVREYRELCLALDEMMEKSNCVQDDIPVLTSKYLNGLLGLE